MSGPGQSGGGTQVAAPGWYPDPDGGPGLVRWWNGVTWSDVTTPAGPGVDVGSAFEPVPQRPAAPWTAAPPRRSSTAPLLVGGGVLVAGVVVVLVAVLLGRSGSSTPVATSAAVTAPAGPTFDPGTVRIVDEEAGISYPFLGDGWYEYASGVPFETTSVAGQFFVTQEGVPSGGQFIAQVTSGPVAEGYGWAGPGSEQATALAVADSARGNYYPAPNERAVLRDEAMTVDGAPAWLYEFTLSWDVEGYEASGERAAMLVVDVGRPAPALLYISIPNTHAELYGVVDRVLEAVEVL